MKRDTTNIQKQIDFLKGCMNVTDTVEKIFSEVLENVDQIKHAEGLYSGGGYTHLIMQLHNEKILCLHFAHEECEISFNRWPSIRIYLDYSANGSETGFGYECNFKNYEYRTASIEQWKTFLKYPVNEVIQLHELYIEQVRKQIKDNPEMQINSIDDFDNNAVINEAFNKLFNRDINASSMDDINLVNECFRFDEINTLINVNSVIEGYKLNSTN